MKAARRASYWRWGAQEGSRKKRQQGVSSITGVPRCEVNFRPICWERVAAREAPSKGRAPATGRRGRERQGSGSRAPAPPLRPVRGERGPEDGGREEIALTPGSPQALKSRRETAPGAPRRGAILLHGNRRWPLPGPPAAAPRTG